MAENSVKAPPAGARGAPAKETPTERSGAYERLSLDLASVPGPRRLAVEDFRSAKGSNPYQRVETAGKPAAIDSAPTRRDLRKLSDWIKLKRELEERKLRGDVDEEDSR